MPLAYLPLALPLAFASGCCRKSNRQEQQARAIGSKVKAFASLQGKAFEPLRGATGEQLRGATVARASFFRKQDCSTLRRGEISSGETNNYSNGNYSNNSVTVDLTNNKDPSTLDANSSNTGNKLTNFK